MQKDLCGLAGWRAALALQGSEPAAQTQGLGGKAEHCDDLSALRKAENHILPNPGPEAGVSTPLPSPNACRSATEPVSWTIFRKLLLPRLALDVVLLSRRSQAYFNR